MADLSVTVHYQANGAPTVEPWSLPVLPGDTVTWESDPEIASLRIDGKTAGQLEKYFAIPNNGQKRPKTTRRNPKKDRPPETPETVPYSIKVRFDASVGRPPEDIDPDMVMDT